MRRSVRIMETSWGSSQPDWSGHHPPGHQTPGHQTRSGVTWVPGDQPHFDVSRADCEVYLNRTGSTQKDEKDLGNHLSQVKWLDRGRELKEVSSPLYGLWSTFPSM